MDDRGGSDPPGRDGGDEVVGRSFDATLTNNTLASTTAQPAFDLPAFESYLLQLLPLVIQAAPRDLDALFRGSDFAERASRWAADPTAGALYIVKQRAEPTADPEQGELIPPRRDEPAGDHCSSFNSQARPRSPTRCRRRCPTRRHSPRRSL